MLSVVRDERGVSKVVGGVLLLGITMLLVAAVATITTGVAGEAPTQEQVDVQQSVFSFEFETNTTYDPSNMDGAPSEDGIEPPHDAYIADLLTVTYESGSILDSENLVLQIEGSSSKYVKPNGDLGGASYQSTWTFAEIGAPTQLEPGASVTTVTIMHDIYNMGFISSEMDSATVRIVYEFDSGESTTLAEWEGPDA